MMKALANIGTKLVKFGNSAGLVIRKKSPEILLAVGVAGFVGTVVAACAATLKADKILDEHEEKMEDVERAYEIASADPDQYDYTEDDYKKDKTIVTLKTSGKMAKLYAPTIALGAVSLACILSSRNILQKRYLGAVAAYNGLSEVFKTYRKRVVDEYGEKLDQHFRYGTTYSSVTEKETDEDGKTTKKKVDVEETPAFSSDYSDTAVIFDESNPNWDPNSNFSMMFLRAQQNYANDKFHQRGHMFLNEVYDLLGFPHTPAGAVLGWKMGCGDNEIDFGLFDLEKDQNRKFVNGKDNVVILDFNHDGVIWDKI